MRRPLWIAIVAIGLAASAAGWRLFARAAGRRLAEPNRAAERCATATIARQPNAITQFFVGGAVGTS